MGVVLLEEVVAFRKLLVREVDGSAFDKKSNIRITGHRRRATEQWY
jgi:hypothetical protein